MVAKNSVGIAFAHHYISRQSPTLIVHLYFLQVFLYVLFVAQKAPKTPGTGKDVNKRVKRQARLSVLERVITSY